MGDFRNIDLLKVDSHRPTHDFLELIHFYSLMPTIYKPTRFEESTATIIDNILTSSENIIKSLILVTDINDHFDKFSPNKCAGYDSIGNFIVKKVSNEIVEPLTRILNLSISTGVVPEKLK